MILQDEHNPATSTIPPAVYPQQATNTYWFAQSFVANTTYSITQVALRLARNVWTSGATVTVSIKAVDVDHNPTGADLVSATKSFANLPTQNPLADHYGAGMWGIFTFNSPVELTEDTEYTIVVRTNGAGNGLYWTQQTSGETGYFSYSSNSGVTWDNTASRDFCYQTYSNYTLQDNFEAGVEDTFIGGGDYWQGQTFTATSTYILKSIALRLERQGGAGTFTVSLKATAAGIPSGGDLSVGTLYESNIETGTMSWYEFEMDIPYKVVEGTMYAVVLRTSNATYPGFTIGGISGGDPYDGGTQLYSENAGLTWAAVGGEADDLWFRVYGSATGAGTSPDSDAVTVKRLWAVASNQFWYEDESGDMVVFSDATDDLDTTAPLTAVEAYGKVFIANGENLKVADFSNVKIATDDIGANPPDFGTVLTGDDSGAVLVVDYIDAIAGAVTIYGRRTTEYTFQSGETVTGIDDDGNAISFDTNAAETLPPHWYDWTVFGGDTTTFGTMPANANLVSEYNARLVLAGDSNYPHEWWMSRVYNPWDFQSTPASVSNTYGMATTSGSTDAGQIGDVITALISYGDDFFVFGCSSSLYLLDGDPTYGGTIETLSRTAGIYGARAWCKDHQSNLYFYSGEGLYKAEGGRSKPVSLSDLAIPKWSEDWEANPSLYRIVVTFDPIRNGIIVSQTALSNGANNNYWYDLKTEGFYPESYPDTCGVYSYYYYNSIDSSTRVLLLGCNDGYLRSFYDNNKNDILADDSDNLISSWLTIPVLPLNTLTDNKGKLMSVIFDVGGGTSSDTFQNSDGFTYELFVDNDAETVLENIKDGATAFASGTLSVTGRSKKIRPRAKGYFAAIRLYNTTVSETWAIDRIIGTVNPLQ